MASNNIGYHLPCIFPNGWVNGNSLFQDSIVIVCLDDLLTAYSQLINILADIVYHGFPFKDIWIFMGDTLESKEILIMDIQEW